MLSLRFPLRVAISHLKVLQLKAGKNDHSGAPCQVSEAERQSGLLQECCYMELQHVWDRPMNDSWEPVTRLLFTCFSRVARLKRKHKRPLSQSIAT